MTDAIRFSLPKDVAALARMRDDLSEYLAALERNTDAVDQWLTQNAEKITVAHHQLMRAVTLDRDDRKAAALVSSMGDIAGFVLDLQNFAALAEKNFGGGNAFAAAIAGIAPGIPAAILETLPEVKNPEEGQALPAVPSLPVPVVEKKGGFLSSFFGKSEAEAEKERQEAAKAEAEGILRQWRRVRSEIVALQSDRHYYVDSFMDWVGETLAPSESGADNKKIMEKYQDPEYVIGLAQEDYARVIGIKADGVRRKALEYSELASLLDRQDIGAFIKILPALFPQKETDESLRMKRLLLADFGVRSFADLALSHINGREDQFALYRAALAHEKRADIAADDAQAFERVLGEVLAKDPLDSFALSSTLVRLKAPQELVRKGAPDAFERIALRFENDPALRSVALGRMLSGLDVSHLGHVVDVVNIAELFKAKDVESLISSFDVMGRSRDVTGAFLGLWHLCYPNASFLAKIYDVTDDPEKLGALIDKALSAGVLHEFSIGQSVEKVFSLFKDKILPSLDRFPPAVARKVLAGGGIADWRDFLTRSGGAIEAVMASPLTPDKKLEWVSVLLEPCASNITKANVLFEAAQTAASAEIGRLLLSMERNLVGDNVRLENGKILTNLGRVANVWYNPEKKTMRYTVDGHANVLMTELARPEADEILSLLKRRGGFESEYAGIFKANLIDKYYTKDGETYIAWHSKNKGPLHTDQAIVDRIHARPDFFHEAPKEGGIYSVNGESIFLLKKLEDKKLLMVDKYGLFKVLDGEQVSIPKGSPLIPLGDAWINPDNASIILLDKESGQVSLRMESADFDDFMAKAGAGEYLYSLPARQVEIDAVENVLRAKDTFAMGAHLSFNFRTLGYMSYKELPAAKRAKPAGQVEEKEKFDAGFICRKQAPIRPQGFIPTTRELAQEALRDLRANSALISAGDLIAHKSAIDNAYYSLADQALHLFIGASYVVMPCAEREGIAILKRLASDPDFTVVSTGHAKSGQEVPTDIINTTRVTLLQYNPAKDKVSAIADHDSFSINLNQGLSLELFDRIEEKGKRSVRIGLWVEKLGQTLKTLSPLGPGSAPLLQCFDKADLLNRATTNVLGAVSPAKKASAISRLPKI